MDLAISSIQDRFNQPGYVLYQNFEQLILNAANGKDYSTNMEAVTDFYGDDFNQGELSTQLQIFSSSFPHSDDEIKSAGLKDILSYPKGQKSFYRQICWIARLILVMPSTNAASERSFSAMRRLKTYLRSTMSDARLNHVIVCNLYKDMLDRVDVTVAANEFVQGSEHRLSIFGKF